MKEKVTNLMRRRLVQPPFFVFLAGKFSSGGLEQILSSESLRDKYPLDVFRKRDRGRERERKTEIERWIYREDKETQIQRVRMTE